MNVARLVFPPLSYIGWGALQRLPEEVSKYAPSTILVVTDPVLVSIGIAERVVAPLRDAGYRVEIYQDVPPEPPLAAGERIVSYIRGGKFDLVIGLGGGSALDLAKLAAVMAKHEGAVKDYLNLTGTKTITSSGLPKILIPTTAGTGSEVTNITVLSLEHTKDVIAHDGLLADAVIVDPELTVTVPPRVTAATGVDALTHAVEAYVSVNASPTSDALALHAIRLIGRSLRKAVVDGKDVDARTDLGIASYMAGLAFFNAGVAGVHALAYPLGGQFHIAHGDSNAVLLPYVMQYIRKSCAARMADILQALGGYSVGLTEEEASALCAIELGKLVSDVGIPATLGQFNVPRSALESLSLDAVKQTRLLARSPMPLHLEDIRSIYALAFEGGSTDL
jgi:alcohol dehydrogenase class IV